MKPTPFIALMASSAAIIKCDKSYAEIGVVVFGYYLHEIDFNVNKMRK